MPPKKNKPVEPLIYAEKEKEEIRQTKQRFKRDMDHLGPVLEEFAEDLDEYQSAVNSHLLDPGKLKNEFMLQRAVVGKLEAALNALQEAATLVGFAEEVVTDGAKKETASLDGADKDGARKKKKSSE